MKASELAELVVAELIALGGWGSAPVDPVWFPDFDSKQLRALGLTALAIVPEATTANASRGGRQSAEPMCHVAIIKPIAGADHWEDGKTVVDKADAVIDRLLGKRLDVASPGIGWAMCMSVEHAPVISAEHAKQFALWVSYLKLKFQTGNK